jgi:putative polyhydroxyalkanoate system protein
VSQIVVRRQHRLDAVEVRRLAEAIARRVQRQYGGHFGWDGDRLSFSRVGASGHVAVGKRAVEVLVDIGLLLRPLRSRIEREIHGVLDEHLGAATAHPSRPAARRSASTRSSRSQGASRSARPK